MFRILPSKLTMKDKPDQHEGHLIRLKDVVKSYKTEAGDFLALKNISLSIGTGEFVGIIGKSGSGKSTLINMITGIDRPTRGEVFVSNTAIHNLSEGRMAQWRGHNLGIVFQFFQLLPILTVLENVMLPMDFCNLYNQRQRKEKAMQVLDLVGVSQQAHKLPSQLSGGEQQRVAIARALANDPPIIMADEPTGNLDSKTSSIVFEVFAHLVASGKTIVMVTHDGDLAKRVDRTIIIADGEIIEEYLARAFPTLSQQQLIQTTSKLTLEKYAPGEPVIQRGEPPEKFHFVTRGEVEVVLTAKDGQEIVTSRLKRGQYFGGIELIRNSEARLATIRACGQGPVEVSSLDKQSFNALIKESPATRDAIYASVEERLKSTANLLEEN
jgi:ABC-type lipoprotein export system ATPase subunit